jgi:hypothetical protein
MPDWEGVMARLKRMGYLDSSDVVKIELELIRTRWIEATIIYRDGSKTTVI